jgi:hypothetical protein
VSCGTSWVVPGAHRVVGPGTHRGSGPKEVHTTVTDRSDRSPGSGSANGTGLTDAHDRSDRSPGKSSSSIFRDKDEVEDWRKLLVDYLQNSSSSVDRKVRRWALKFVLDNGEF